MQSKGDRSPDWIPRREIAKEMPLQWLPTALLDANAHQRRLLSRLCRSRPMPALRRSGGDRLGPTNSRHLSAAWSSYKWTVLRMSELSLAFHRWPPRPASLLARGRSSASVAGIVRMMLVPFAPAAGHFGWSAVCWAAWFGRANLLPAFFRVGAVLAWWARTTEPFSLRIFAWHRYRSCW